MSNGEVCSVRVQYRDVVGVANLLSLRRVMLEMLGKHVDRLPMLSHHRRWRSCPLRHRNYIRSASASTLDAPTRKGPAPRTRAGSAFDLHLESFPMLTQSCDFTLLFRVSYPVMISEPVSFSLFSGEGFSTNLSFGPFHSAVRELLVSTSLSACFQLWNFLYHEIEIPKKIACP